MEHKQKGTPYKIIGNTALIQDMFTSDLDVARHKDVVIWTASGIRGKVIEVRMPYMKMISSILYLCSHALFPIKYLNCLIS